MEVTHSRVDLEACLAAGHKPCEIVERKPNEEWLVSHDAIRMDRPIAWSPTVRETDVWIPLVPYLTHRDADLAMAFMVQLGMCIRLEVGRPILRVHFATGYPVNEVSDPQHGDALQYYLGFGIVLGE